jgi:hypothetical protein
MRVLRPAFAPPGRLSRPLLEKWADWDLRHGILSRPLDVGRAFDFGLQSRAQAGQTIR